MSMQIGVPIGPDIPEGEGRDLKTFDHVPQLWELLPNGGWPGVVYAQVCIHNLKAAADREERPDHLKPIRGSTYYSIQGPRGRADMALVGRGKPIPGAAPEAGARLFFTDGEVMQQTGLRVEMPIWFSEPPQEEADGSREIEVASRADRAGEGPQGDARVQGRRAPQRIVERARREEPEASGRHRDERGEAKPKRFLKGHNHPPNFGRIMEGCSGCAGVVARRNRHELHGMLGRER